MGAAEAAVVHAGFVYWRPGFEQGQDWITADTDVTPDGEGVMGVNWLVVRAGGALLLVDPCTFGPHEFLRLRKDAGPSIEDALDVLGLAPGEVTHIAITHGHGEHVMGLVDRARAPGTPRFPNAEVFFPRADWEQEVVRDAGGRRVHLLPYLEPVQRAGKLRLVDGGERVGPAVLVATGGESPGHQVVRIETSAAPIYYLGDLVHFPAEFRHPDWVTWSEIDREALVPARRRLFAEAADRGAAVVFTHGRFPAWGRLEPSGDGWLWHYL